MPTNFFPSKLDFELLVLPYSSPKKLFVKKNIIFPILIKQLDFRENARHQIIVDEALTAVAAVLTPSTGVGSNSQRTEEVC